MKKPCIQDDCTKPSYARERCRSHYTKAHRAGTLPPKRPYEDVVHERFWSRVEKAASCWNWIGARTRAGYGAMSVDGKVHLVHRLSYQASRGPIDAGVLIDHICHNKACVNPDHLRPASYKQNSENMLGANRKSKSGIRGVWYVPSAGKWAAQFTHNGHKQTVGTFTSAAEAEAAVVAKRNEFFTHNDADRIGIRNEADHVPLWV